MTQNNSPPLVTWGLRISGATATLIGGYWLAAWLGGWAAQWSAAGAITMKTNMALGQVLAGVALLLLAGNAGSQSRRAAGSGLAAVVFLIGALTLSEHLFGFNLGIDELLATEAPGATATASPNRMGPPGSASLALLGAGFLALAWGRRGVAPYSGLAVCLINLVPAVGFLYGIQDFFRQPGLTGIAWPTVVVLFSLGIGLILAQRESGPLALLLRDDAGGRLVRQTLPVVVLVPLAIGWLHVLAERRGLYDNATGHGMVILAVTLFLSALLWRSAVHLSRSTAAEAEAYRTARASEARYHTLFSTMTEGFALHQIVTDEQGRPCDYIFLDANPAFERLTGLKRADLLGKRVREILPAIESHWIESYGRVALTGEPAHFENHAAALDRWYEVFAYRTAPGQFAVVFTDITDRKRAEEERERLISELEAAIKELEGFTYSVSHDLRAPIRHMNSYAQLLKRDAWAALGEQSRLFLDTVLNASRKMAILVDELLEFSRMGRTELKESMVDLNALLREVILNFSEETKGRDIQWRINPMPRVWGDASMLHLAFLNLIGNALKFTRNRSPASIEIGYREEGAEHIIFVRDNGVGFDMEYSDKLFLVFQRLHTAEEFEGTGIGLANVQRIVHRHGGRVWAEGKIGEGATFAVVLPKGGKNG